MQFPVRVRPRTRAVLGALLASVAAGCDGPTSPEDRAAEVRLGERALTLFEGRSDTLAATVLTTRRAVVERARVRWSSADTTVAAVDSAGVVTARQIGTTWIVAAVQRSGGTRFADSAEVLVRARPERVQGLNSYVPGVLSAGVPIRAPARFRVLDRFEKGVPGVTVRFSTAQGATLSATSAVTDSLGEASTDVTWIPGPGTHSVYAHVEGLHKVGDVPVLVDPPLKVVLTPDSIVIPAPGCESANAFVRLFAPDGTEVAQRTPGFRFTEPGIARLQRPLTARGLYANQVMEVKGQRAGVTHLIASYLGAADTAVVRVLSDEVSSFTIARVPGGDLPLGRTYKLAAYATFAGCGVETPVLETSFRSLDDRVATVGQDGVVTARGLGTTQIVGSWRDVSATLTVTVRDYGLLPADTTVAVGDTVRYVIRATGADGRVALYRPILPEPTGPAVKTGFFAGPDAPVAIGLQPGEATVAFRADTRDLLYNTDMLFTAEVKVVPRPE